MSRDDGEQIVSFVADIRDEDSFARAAREAQCVSHMAAQVAVTTSMADPRDEWLRESHAPTPEFIATQTGAIPAGAAS